MKLKCVLRLKRTQKGLKGVRLHIGNQLWSWSDSAEADKWTSSDRYLLGCSCETCGYRWSSFPPVPPFYCHFQAVYFCRLLFELFKKGTRWNQSCVHKHLVLIIHSKITWLEMNLNPSLCQIRWRYLDTQTVKGGGVCGGGGPDGDVTSDLCPNISKKHQSSSHLYWFLSSGLVSVPPMCTLTNAYLHFLFMDSRCCFFFFSTLELVPFLCVSNCHIYIFDPNLNSLK